MPNRINFRAVYFSPQKRFSDRNKIPSKISTTDICLPGCPYDEKLSERQICKTAVSANPII
jgi:hypothetical protein